MIKVIIAGIIMGLVGLVLTKFLMAKFDVIEEEDFDDWDKED